jgi:hypothetical protein
MPAATVIIACLIGFRFYALDGACIAGGVAWLVTAGGSWIGYSMAWELVANGFNRAWKQRSETMGCIESVRRAVETVDRRVKGDYYPTS